MLLNKYFIGFQSTLLLIRSGPGYVHTHAGCTDVRKSVSVLTAHMTCACCVPQYCSGSPIHTCGSRACTRSRDVCSVPCYGHKLNTLCRDACPHGLHKAHALLLSDTHNFNAQTKEVWLCVCHQSLMHGCHKALSPILHRLDFRSVSRVATHAKRPM